MLRELIFFPRPILEERLGVMQKQDREMTMTPVSSSVEPAPMFPGLRWVIYFLMIHAILQSGNVV